MACTNHPEVTQGLSRCSRCRRSFCPSCVIRLRGFVYCAGCKGEQVRDIQSGSAAGELELASLGRRFGALWLDSLIFTLLWAGGTLLLLPALTAAGTTEPGTTFVIGLMVVPFHTAQLVRATKGEDAAVNPLVYAGVPIALALGAAAVLLPLRAGARALRGVEF